VNVSNVPLDMNHQQLHEMFMTFDNEKREIRYLKINRNPDHSSKGTAFVVYENHEDA